MAVTCGAADWHAVNRWGKAKGKWLATFIDLAAGISKRRLRQGHCLESFSRLCRISLNQLKKDKSIKVGIANKRLNRGWDNDYPLKILMNLA